MARLWRLASAAASTPAGALLAVLVSLAGCGSTSRITPATSSVKLKQEEVRPVWTVERSVKVRNTLAPLAPVCPVCSDSSSCPPAKMETDLRNHK